MRVLIPTNSGDQEVDVQGLSIVHIRDLLQRFPDAVLAIAEKGGAGGVQSLLKLGPDVIAAVIASACGAHNDPDAERVAANLPLGLQVEIVTFVWKWTMPRGPAPFKELLRLSGLDLAMVRKQSASTPPQESQPSS